MKNTSHSSGFTLVEIAIVLTIIGVMLGSGILALTGALNDIRYRTTRDRLNGVANALALYAQQNYFLPCPAVPPDNNGMTTGVDPGTCYGAASPRGIVPYVALGLTAEQVRDSYGNFFTYVVNPLLATNNVQTNATAQSQVHDSCRINNGIWITASSLNKNQRKALFCCMARNAVSDTVVNNGVVGPVALSPTRSIANRGAVNGASAVTVPANTASQTAAFILISHGKNGFGAYRPSSPPARYADPSGLLYRQNEIANADDADNIYVSSPYSVNTDETVRSYFDDIVIWRTQDQLIGAFGRDSCARP